VAELNPGRSKIKAQRSKSGFTGKWREITAMLFMLAAVLHAGTISGTVRSLSSGKPVTGALVEVLGTSALTSSDSSGFYTTTPLAPGSYNLSFSGKGFQTQLRNDVYVSGEGDIRVDVDLAPAVFELEKSTVTATAFRKAADMAASTKTMNFDEILRQPGALADVQRAIQDLPSVASGGDNVNEVVVRGGVPGENLFIMDNIEISNPNHFAQQGSGGGVVSLINPLLVKGLTFSAGAPPAQYGGKSSSVLDVTLRDGNDKLLLGGVDMGIGGLGIHAEGPLWKGATFMASGAKSFLDFVARFDPSTAIPNYWGLQAKLAQKLGDHKLTFNMIYGDNAIAIGNAVEDLGTRGEDIKAGGYIYAGGATLRSYWGDRLSSIVTLSGTGNRFDRKEFTPEDDPVPEIDYFTNNSVEQEQALKAEATYNLTESNKIIAGGFGKRADFNIDVAEFVDTLKTYAASTDTGTDSLDNEGNPVVSRPPYTLHGVGYKYGAYFSSVLHPIERLKIVPGIRFDGFDYNHSLTLSPRLSAVFSLMDNLDLTGAFGIQYQDPDYTALVASELNHHLKPKQAITGIGGVEYTVSPWATKFMIEGFYKRYSGLAVDSSYLSDVPYITKFSKTNTLLSRQHGKSYGVELFIQKKLTKNFSGSASYSYSQAWYEDVRPSHTGEWYRADYDFRHGVTLSGGYKFELLAREWYEGIHNKLWFVLLSPVMPIADRTEFSARWRYLGGRPYTRPEYIDRYQLWGIDAGGQLNARQYLPYHRLDLRWERRFGFGFLQMIYYIDLQNVYSRRNEWQYLFVDGNRDPVTIYQLPFMPAGGVIIGF
jgi:hypothetical protein